MRPMSATNGWIGSVVGALVFGCCLAACDSSSGFPERTPFPLPSGAVAVALPTQPPAAPLPAGQEWACPGEGIRGTLTWDAVSRTVSIGAPTFRWPRGFSARESGGHVEIVAPDGSVVAREGDVITVSGKPDICAVNGQIYGPST